MVVTSHSSRLLSPVRLPGVTFHNRNMFLKKPAIMEQGGSDNVTSLEFTSLQFFERDVFGICSSGFKRTYTATVRSVGDALRRANQRTHVRRVFE